jgi:uroporphyrinogen-III synthase
MEVTQVTAYRTVPESPAFERLLPPLGAENWDAVLFTSGLIVQLFHDVLTSVMDREAAAAWLQRNRAMVLGRSAESALERLGAAAALLSPRPSMPEFVRAVIRNLSGPNQTAPSEGDPS